MNESSFGSGLRDRARGAKRPVKANLGGWSFELCGPDCWPADYVQERFNVLGLGKVSESGMAYWALRVKRVNKMKPTAINEAFLRRVTNEIGIAPEQPPAKEVSGDRVWSWVVPIAWMMS